MAESPRKHSWEPLVVYTAELAAVIEPTLKVMDDERTEHLEVYADRDENFRLPLSGNGWVAANSTQSTQAVSRIRNEEYKYTALSKADVILTALGLSHALGDGRIRVIPNPRLSQERWIEMMQKRGCCLE